MITWCHHYSNDCNDDHTQQWGRPWCHYYNNDSMNTWCHHYNNHSMITWCHHYNNVFMITWCHHYNNDSMIIWCHHYNNDSMITWCHHYNNDSMITWCHHYNNDSMITRCHHYNNDSMITWCHHYNNDSMITRCHHYNNDSLSVCYLSYVSCSVVLRVESSSDHCRRLSCGWSVGWLSSCRHWTWSYRVLSNCDFASNTPSTLSCSKIYFLIVHMVFLTDLLFCEQPVNPVPTVC